LQAYADIKEDWKMELKDIRAGIDKIDNQIAELYVKRMELSKEVAKAKAEKGLSVENAEREKEVLSRVTLAMPEEIKLFGKQIFESLFETSKAYQYSFIDTASEIKTELNDALLRIAPFPINSSVACQGVSGAYSCKAADKLFPIASVSCFKSWDAVFSAVEKGFCEFGILPIENSTAGSVIEVYDLMRKHKFHIVRSVRMPIKHYLLAPRGVKIEDIKEIASHDQALRQCAEFLKGFSGVKITRCDNTALAAKLAAESGRKDIACIASKDCADIYGLDVLSSGVNDNGSNYTRFIAISKQLEIFEGANRISITANLAHEAGSLNKLLNRFAALGLNLTKLESRPLPDCPFEFAFYFDFEADVREPEVQNLLAEISRKADSFEFLGAYEEL